MSARVLAHGRRAARPLWSTTGGANSMAKVNTKRIEQFLYDEGPSRVPEIAEALSLGESWVSDLIQNMNLEGLVTSFRRGQKIYWMLTNP